MLYPALRATALLLAITLVSASGAEPAGLPPASQPSTGHGGLSGMLQGAGPVPGGPATGAPGTGAPGAAGHGPDVNTAPAAAWLKPGARLSFDHTHGTHYFAPNQIAPGQPGDQGKASFEDPNNPGHWLTVHAYKSEAVAHIVQYQIVAVTDRKVYCAFDMWQPTHTFLPGGEVAHCNTCPAALVFPIGNIDNVYFSPALLAATPDVNAQGKMTRRETINQNGRQVAALNTLTYGGAVYDSGYYDLETGIALSKTSQFQAPNEQWVVDGQSARGALVIDTLRFRDVRQIPYPWAGKPAPDWIRTVKSLKYTVEQVAEDRTALRPPVPHTEKLAFQVMDRGADWIALGIFEPGKTPGPGVEPMHNSLFIGGTSSRPGSPFLPPAGLADLKQGQQIDSDPLSRMTLTVTSIERKGKADVVGFTSAGPTITSRTFYNRATGALLYQQVDTLVIPGHIEHIKLSLTATE